MNEKTDDGTATAQTNETDTSDAEPMGEAAKDGVSGMRTVKEKLESDAAAIADAEAIGEVDEKAVKADPSVPNVLAAGTIEDEMPGVTNPRETLDSKRSGPEALARLKSGPHAPEVTIIDGEPLKTGSGD